MQLPPNDSVFWILARQVIIGVAMFAFVAFAYQNKMASQDIVMILTTMGGVFGLDVLKHAKASDTPDDSGKKDE